MISQLLVPGPRPNPSDSRGLLARATPQRIMSVLRFSPEHIAKVTAFQKMFWQLKTGLKHEVRTFNSFLFSAKLIGDETLEKADIEVTLREVKAKLECNEEIFEVLLTVLSRMTRGEDIVRDFRSRFDEQLKMPRPEESVDSLLSFPEPYQVTPSLAH